MEITSPVSHSRIISGDSKKDLDRYIDARKHVVIADRKVHRLHPGIFRGRRVIEVDGGEEAKTLQTVERIYRKLLEAEIDRFALIVGVGGGVTCDISGFCASTYMRGLPFGFVPSTLLAQVDASIGGKNGVNLGGYKNIIGVFRQPDFVLLDFSLLETLPKRQLRCGIAEIVKHALIENAGLFCLLDGEWEGLLSLRHDIVERVVMESIAIKSRIVQVDATEIGERRKLNFGHTLGHALEKTCALPHGEAVSIGMAAAARISVSRGMLSREEADKIEILLHRFRLPTSLPADAESLMDAMKKDKKRESGDIRFILLSGIGKAEVVTMSYGELKEHLDDLCQHL